MSTPRVTLLDVARRAGVSRTTASFVMTGRTDMRISVVARRIEGSSEPVGMAKRVMLHQIKEIERDLPIWEHMSYRARPVLAPDEARGFKVLRNWASQFYPR